MCSVIDSARLVCFSFMLTLRSILQVTAFDAQGYLDPEDPEYPYFALRDSPEEVVYRAAYWQEEGKSLKDLKIYTVTFTAVGVATLFPSVLYVQPGIDQTRYRFNGRLCRLFKSRDDQLLYSISAEWYQVI
jgi:hypothetical protein